MKLFKHIALAVLLLLATPAGAIELAGITVDSHLGEPFFARVPFILNEGEMASNLSVELATTGDYRTLNVHFNPALRLIRSDIVRDRQSNWIELSSHSPIEAPVFSLVLKMRYGHATHFKKYPILLKIADAHRPAKRAVATPDTSIDNTPETKPAKQPAADSTYIYLDPSIRSQEEVDAGPVTTESVIGAIPFKPFDGWARRPNYGPVIYGDTLYTIADRLRMDERYTIRQVMVALFEKNRSMFAEGNLNLPIDGTYLVTPLAEEVEKHTYAEALSIIQTHDGRWKELVKQPRYAAVAEAQQSRYKGNSTN